MTTAITAGVEGVKAYKAGAAIDDNPYSTETEAELHEAWRGAFSTMRHLRRKAEREDVDAVIEHRRQPRTHADYTHPKDD